MKHWNNVVAGLDSANETINFGTRAVAQSNTAVFETTTLATISADENVPYEFVPKCKAQYSELGIGICVGNTFHLFDKSCNSLLFSKNFTSPIACFEILRNDPYVIFVLEGGNLCYVNMDTGRETLDTFLLESEVCGISSTDNARTLIIVLSCGQVVEATFSPYESEPDTTLAHENEDETDLCANFKLLFKTKFSPASVSKVFLHSSEEHGFFEADSNFLYFSSLKGGSKILLPLELSDIDVKMIEVSKRENFVVCLTSEGKLLRLCPFTGVFIGCLPENPVSDIAVIDYTTGDSSITSLLMLTTGDNPELVLTDVHDFSIVFRLKVSQNVFIVDNQSNVEDHLFVEYLEGTLRIKSIAHTQPEFRLARLIQRGRYTEARQFADIFNLDKKEVYIGEVKSLASSLYLSRGLCETELNGNFEKLQKLLTEITDDDFVIEFCVSSMAPDMAKAQKLVEYAVDRASASSSNQLLNLALSTQLHLGTFLLVHGPSATPDDWFKFGHHPVKLAVDFFQQGNLSAAAIVCCRHQEKIIQEITSDDALSFLNFPPSVNTNVSELIEWVKHFTPIILSTRLKAFPAWVTWIVETVRTIETQSSDTWPDSALTLTESAFIALEKCKALSITTASLERMYLESFKVTSKSPLSELNVLFWSLTQIQKLKKDFSILIPYVCFSEAYDNEEGSQQLILKLFEKIDENKLSDLMDGFIVPLFHGAPRDISSIICYYLDMTASDFETKGIMSESRFITFANLINNTADKLRAVNTILTWTRVPWSKAVEELANQALKMEHPSVEAVRRHYKLVPKKAILQKYRFPVKSAHDENDIGQLSLYINRIYRKGNPEMLEDAIVLASSYSAGHLLPYSCLLYKYLQAEPPRGIDFDGITKNLDKTQRLELYRGAWMFCRDKTRSGSNNAYIAEIKSAIEFRIRSLEGDESSTSGVKEIKTSEKLKAIGVDCKMHPLPSQSREDILRECVESLDLSGENILELNKNVSKAVDVACVLKYPRQLAWLELASRCCQESKFELAARFFIALEDSQNDFFKVYGQRFLQLIYNIVLKCSTSGSIDPELARVLSSNLINSLVNGTDIFRDLNLKLDLIKVCRIFETSTFKPVFYDCYKDPMESQMFRLHPNILVPIVSRIKTSRYECDHNSLLQAIEQLINFDNETLPKNLSTVNKMFYLTVLLRKLNFTSPESQKKLKKYVGNVVSTVLLSIFNQRRRVSTDLAFAMLNYFTLEKAACWLYTIKGTQKFTTDKALSNNINQVALQFFASHSQEVASNEKLSSVYAYFRNNHKRSYWELKGQCLGVPSKDCCLEKLEGQKKFLARLVTRPNVKMNMMIKYCQDFGLSGDECYVPYLKHIILSWRPKFTYSNSGSAKKLIVEDDLQELTPKCVAIGSKIQCKEEFGSPLLSELWKEVNTYYYEAISVILELSATCFKENVTSWMVAFNFLKSYTRHGSPSQDEMTEWYATHTATQAFSEIGNYRLPLKSIPFPHSVLEAEVCLENYERWLAAPPALHNLTRDIICSLAIHNLKNREPRQNGSWNLVHQQKDLLGKILKCVSMIGSLEVTVACLYYTVNQVMSPGIDQVEAAQKCYLKAQEWANRDKTADSLQKLQKAEKKYLTVSTIHILHTYGLAYDKYLQNASDPNQLIYELYHDRSITDSHTSWSLGVRDVGAPDINGAVERIATLYDVDLTKIALELLAEWFQPPAYSDNTLNETVMNACLERENADCRDNSNCIVRASYMLRGREDAADVENYLMAHAFPRDHENSTKPHAMRLKALKCLMGIRTVEQLERITSRKIDAIRNYALTLEILSDLDAYGLNYSLSGFERAVKINVVERLFSLSSFSSEPILLAVKICLKFEITSQKTWDALLVKLMELKLYAKLHEILQTIGHAKASFTLIRKAWEFLSNSLINKNKWGTHEKPHAEELMDFVRSCPNRSYLNVPLIAECLRQANRPDLAEILI